MSKNTISWVRSFPQWKYSPTFAIKSILKTALRMAPSWSAGEAVGNET